MFLKGDHHREGREVERRKGGEREREGGGVDREGKKEKERK